MKHSPSILDTAGGKLAWHWKQHRENRGTGVPTSHTKSQSPESISVTDSQHNSFLTPRQTSSTGAWHFIYQFILEKWKWNCKSDDNAHYSDPSPLACAVGRGRCQHGFTGSSFLLRYHSLQSTTHKFLYEKKVCSLCLMNWHRPFQAFFWFFHFSVISIFKRASVV